MSRDALVVGINHYQNLHLLQSPAQDAEAIANLLSQYGKFRVQRVPEQIDPFDHSVRVSKQREVTLTSLKQSLVKLFKPQGQHVPETALLFFSGHGLREDQGIQEGFLATSDAKPEAGFYGVSLQWLRRLLEESPVKQQVVWLDCCFSGELMNFKQVLAETNPAAREERDRHFISACREFELSYERQDGQHGVLTQILLHGIDPVHRSDGWVTNYTLTDSIKEKLSTEIQCPIFQNQGRAIVLTNTRLAVPNPDIKAKTSPYRALNYFREADADFFHGRTQFTDELIQTVAKENFVAVIGPSGSGKSSVVRAGLLHQLRLGQRLTGSHAWMYLPVFTPGEHPAASLKQATGIALEHLQSSIVMASSQRVVMVIDQFEECFTLCQNPDERKAFFGALLGTLGYASPKFCLIIAMRADFLGHCTEYPTLARLMDRLMTVKPMNEHELKEAIVNPAKKVGLEVEPQLITRMIEDVIHSPGSLPLLQFALTILWDTRREPYGNALTLYAYNRLGGIKGALERVANEAYDRLSYHEQAIARRIFLELTQLGVGTEDTRRRVLKQDLMTSECPTAVLDQVIQKLVDARLITTDELHDAHSPDSQATVIDVAHEALIRHWSKLRQWIDQSQIALRQQRDIQDAAKAWEKQGKLTDAAFLLRGAKLNMAKSYIEMYGATLPLSALAQDYLDTSHRVERRTRLIRIGAIASGVTGICIAALIAIIQGTRALDKAILATANASIKSFRDGHSIAALQDGIRAGTLQRRALWTSTSTRLQTLTALQLAIQNLREINRLDDHTDVVNSIDIADDDDLMVTGSWDRTIKLWQTDGTLLWSRSFDAGIMSVRFSPDKQTIFASDLTGRIHRLTRDGDPLGSKALPVRVAHLEVSPTGETVAIAGGRSPLTLQFWDIEADRFIPTSADHQDTVTDVQFSPNGELVASASEDGTVKLWDAETGTLLATHDQHQDAVTSISFHANGSLIASGDRSGQIKLWTYSQQSIKPSSYQLHPDIEPVSDLAFSSDGQVLAAATIEGAIYVYPMGHNDFLTPIDIFAGHEGNIRSIAFDAGSQKLASVGDDGTLRLWYLRQNWHEGAIHDIAYSPDGSQYASVGAVGPIRVWNASDHSLDMTLGTGETPQRTVAFTPDQRYLISSSREQIELWNLETGTLSQTLSSPEGYINDIAIHPAGDLLASVGQDAKIYLWSLSNGSLSHTLEGHDDEILTVHFSPDGQFLATAGWDQTIHLWTVDDQALRHTLVQPNESHSHAEGVFDVAFHPNDESLVSAGLDNLIYHWSIPDGQLLNQWPMPQSDVARIAFSPDGSILASTSTKNIVLWDAKHGTAFATYEGHTKGVMSLAFSPDGNTLISGGGDRRILHWSLDLKQLLENGCYLLQDYLEHGADEFGSTERDRQLCRSVYKSDR